MGDRGRAAMRTVATAAAGLDYLHVALAAYAELQDFAVGDEARGGVPLLRNRRGADEAAAETSLAVWKSNLQPDFNVRVCECFNATSSASLRELDESNRSVQKSAESTRI